jgi:hypothetical protein
VVALWLVEGKAMRAFHENAVGTVSSLALESHVRKLAE